MVIVIGARTVIVNVFVNVAFVESVTFRVKLNGPATVGVPVSVPVPDPALPGENVNPFGTVAGSESKVRLRAPVPPEDANEVLYVRFTIAFGKGDAVEIVSCAKTGVATAIHNRDPIDNRMRFLVPTLLPDRDYLGGPKVEPPAEIEVVGFG